MDSLKALKLKEIGDFVIKVVNTQESKKLGGEALVTNKNLPIDFLTLVDQMTRVFSPKYKSYLGASFCTRQTLMNKYLCVWCRREDKQYFCPNCIRYYPTSAKYRDHLRDNHIKGRSRPSSKLKTCCKICSKPVPKPNMKSHMRSHVSLEELGNKCEHCGEYFRSKQSLRDHINTKHNQTRNYRCPYCQKQCLTTHLRYTHINNIHFDKKEGFKCTECPAVFKRQAKLTGHIQLEHTDRSVFGELTCLQCQKKFQTLYQLRMHKHSCPANRQKWECPICSKNISTKTNLDQHILTHTGELPYKCDAPGCGKRFRTSTNLGQHSKTHQKEKPHSCADCDIQFRLPHHLRNHLKTSTHAETAKKSSKVVEEGKDPVLEESTHSYFLRRTQRKTTL